MHQTFAVACMHFQQLSSALAACISIHSLQQHASGESLIQHLHFATSPDVQCWVPGPMASPMGHLRDLVPFITLIGIMHRHLQQYAPAFAAACIGIRIRSMHALAFAAACINIRSSMQQHSQKHQSICMSQQVKKNATLSSKKEGIGAGNRKAKRANQSENSPVVITVGYGR